MYSILTLIGKLMYELKEKECTKICIYYLFFASNRFRAGIRFDWYLYYNLYRHITALYINNKLMTTLFLGSIHCNGNSEYIFLFWELRGLSPNFHIHVSLSDLYIPRISLHISSSRTGRPIVGIYNSLTDT